MTCEEAMELANSIMIDLNVIEENNPDAKEYLDGVKDVISQILKSLDKNNYATERQIITLLNIQQGIGKWLH